MKLLKKKIMSTPIDKITEQWHQCKGFLKKTRNKFDLVDRSAVILNNMTLSHFKTSLSHAKNGNPGTDYIELFCCRDYLNL